MSDDLNLESIVDINSKEELSEFLDRDALLFARNVSSRAFQRDVAVSTKDFIKILYDGLDLSFAGVYINSGNDVAAEINRSSGDAVYGKISDISPHLLELSSCKLIKKTSGYCFISPLEFRGNSFGTAVFDKQEFSGVDLALIKDVCIDFSRHLNNMRDIPMLRKLADIDHLTGLFNRRKFDRDYDNFRNNLENRGQQFSVIFGDVDRFKSVNDTYGHPYGDSVLKTVAGIMKDTIRDVDIAYRYGGEEFIVILPGADSVEADTIARRINDSIRSVRFVDSLPKDVASRHYHGRRDSSKIRMSMGVASSDEGRGIDLLRAADNRLLTIKDCCRDAVFSSTSKDSLTGIAGLSSFMQYLDNKIKQCNRTWDNSDMDPSSVSVMVFDVVKFSEVVREYGSRNAWDMFRDVARMLYYDHHTNFDYVCRVCDRDSLVVAISGDGSFEKFESETMVTARNYLNKLRSFELNADGNPLTLDFAVGVSLYNPLFAKTPGTLLTKPAPLFGLAENLAGKAGDISERLKVSRYVP